MSLVFYFTLCDALVALLKPLLEIIIYDKNTNIISYISGNIAEKKVGDFVLFDYADLDIIRTNINSHGHMIKSVSLLLEDNFIICLNYDVSLFNEIQKISSLLLSNSQKEAKKLFPNDWQENLNLAIHSYINNKKWHFSSLKNRQKKEIIKHLFENNAFQEKKAADYIAEALTIGRATIFNYLRSWRKHENQLHNEK